MAKKLTLYIMICLIAGIIVGAVLHNSLADKVLLKEIAGYFSIVTDVFLRLIKMIIAPLVFSTLVAGIVHMGDTKSLGRIGLRTMIWFVSATIVSLTLGLILVNVLGPGEGGVPIPLPPTDAKADIEHGAINLKNFITHIFPKSIFEAMSTNEILQIVVFSLFFGVAMTAIGEKAAPITRGVDALVEVMLKITNYVMQTAPIAVFAAMASAVTVNGLTILLTFGKFIGSFYLGLAMLWGALALAGFIVIGPRMGTLIGHIREPILLAFSTASSEAAYPRTLEALERFGVPPRIASFVLPLGYSFNLDGSMMYMTFATLFIAQLYGIHMDWSSQILMVLILMVTSKGIAGVPRASLVVIAGVMPMFKIPEAGIVLIFAVDQFLDMGRSATNVVGNAVATAAVAKWEGQLANEQPASG
ncbi:MAG: dicarboxylate/amino acid:cation symporter [Sphingomonadaceae bacterium]